MTFDFEPRLSPQDPDYVAKVLEARRTPIDEKILAGPRLFDIRCDEARALIRADFPEFSDEQVEDELGRWLEQSRKENDAGIYRDLGPWDVDITDEEIDKLVEQLKLSDGK